MRHYRAVPAELQAGNGSHSPMPVAPAVRHVQSRASALALPRGWFGRENNPGCIAGSGYGTARKRTNDTTRRARKAHDSHREPERSRICSRTDVRREIPHGRNGLHRRGGGRGGVRGVLHAHPVQSAAAYATSSVVGALLAFVVFTLLSVSAVELSLVRPGAAAADLGHRGRGATAAPQAGCRGLQARALGGAPHRHAGAHLAGARAGLHLPAAQAAEGHGPAPGRDRPLHLHRCRAASRPSRPRDGNRQVNVEFWYPADGAGPVSAGGLLARRLRRQDQQYVHLHRAGQQRLRGVLHRSPVSLTLHARRRRAHGAAWIPASSNRSWMPTAASTRMPRPSGCGRSGWGCAPTTSTLCIDTIKIERGRRPAPTPFIG